MHWVVLLAFIFLCGQEAASAAPCSTVINASYLVPECVARIRFDAIFNGTTVPPVDQFIAVIDMFNNSILFTGIEEVLLPFSVGPDTVRAQLFNGTSGPFLCESEVNLNLGAVGQQCVTFDWRLPENYEALDCTDGDAVRPAAWDPLLLPATPGAELTLRNTFAAQISATVTLGQFEWQVANEFEPSNSVQIVDGQLATCDLWPNTTAGKPLWVLQRAPGETYVDRTRNIADGQPPAGTRSAACDGASNPAGYWQNVTRTPPLPLATFYWYYQNVTETVPDGSRARLSASDLQCTALEPGNFAFQARVRIESVCRAVFSPANAILNVLVNGSDADSCDPPFTYDSATNTYEIDCSVANASLLTQPFTFALQVSVGPPVGRTIAVSTFQVGANCTLIGRIDPGPTGGGGDRNDDGADEAAEIVAAILTILLCGCCCIIFCAVCCSWRY
jgi:hypothetical protein